MRRLWQPVPAIVARHVTAGEGAPQTERCRDRSTHGRDGPQPACRELAEGGPHAAESRPAPPPMTHPDPRLPAREPPTTPSYRGSRGRSHTTRVPPARRSRSAAQRATPLLRESAAFSSWRRSPNRSSRLETASRLDASAATTTLQVMVSFRGGRHGSAGVAGGAQVPVDSVEVGLELHQLPQRERAGLFCTCDRQRQSLPGTGFGRSCLEPRLFSAEAPANTSVLWVTARGTERCARRP
jgi:hypothetical protein